MASGSAEKQASFTAEQIDFICCVEQTWWETGAVPTDERINELTGITLGSIKKYWELTHIRNALLARGVDFNPKRAGLLTVTQLNLANLLLNSHDTRSVREKLQSISVTSQQYNAWLRSPAFQNYLSKRAEEMFKASDPDAYMGLVGAVKGGDMRAIQLFFEMRGIYNPRVQVDVNIQTVLVRVVEIISRHVRDPGIMTAIAAEIEMIELGPGNNVSITPTPAMPVLATQPANDTGFKL